MRWPLALTLSLVASCAATPSRVTWTAHVPSRTTRLVLPPLGRVQADRLVDGDPVWLVRTADDEVYVLAADARIESEGRVVRALVSHDPECGCFRGPAPVVWGLDGAISARTEPDYARYWRGSALGIRRSFDGATVYRLDRFDFTRAGDDVEVGERWRATAHSTPERRPSEVLLDVEGPNTECAITTGATAMSDALRLPPGQMVLLAASVRLVDGVPRLCPANESTCSGILELRDDALVGAPGLLFARRVGDGFADLISATCSSSACTAPLHDATWLRTPIHAVEGPQIDAPVSCEEREAPGVRMILVHGRGTRSLSSHAPEGCRTPGSDASVCPEVAVDAFHQALFDALGRHERISFGIGGCFDSGLSTTGRLAAVVYDWRDADAAIAIVSDELARWDVRDDFWVSVEPALCGRLGVN